MKNKYILAAIVTTLALLVISADAVAGTHLLSTLFTSPEGALMAPVMAAALPDAIKAELEKISDQIKSQAETAEKAHR